MRAVTKPGALSESALDILATDMGITRPWLEEVSFDLSYMMIRACSGVHVKVIGELLDMGVDPNWVRGGHGQGIPLCFVNLNGQADAARVRAAVDLLVKRGADLHFIDESREASPIFQGCANPHLLEGLMAAGANIHLKTSRGTTILAWWLHTFSNPGGGGAGTAIGVLDKLLVVGVRKDELVSQSPVWGAHLPKESLLSCMWQSAGLRPLLPEIIQRGFDPMQKGESGKTFLQLAGPTLLGDSSPWAKATVAAMENNPALIVGMAQARADHAAKPARRRARMRA